MTATPDRMPGTLRFRTHSMTESQANQLQEMLFDLPVVEVRMLGADGAPWRGAIVLRSSAAEDVAAVAATLRSDARIVAATVEPGLYP